MLNAAASSLRTGLRIVVIGAASGEKVTKVRRSTFNAQRVGDGVDYVLLCGGVCPEFRVVSSNKYGSTRLDIARDMLHT